MDKLQQIATDHGFDSRIDGSHLIVYIPYVYRGKNYTDPVSVDDEESLMLAIHPIH